VPVPQPGDWLAEQEEIFQTYDRYRRHRKVHPDATRHAIYLLPLGDFDPEVSPSLDALARYTEAFFSMPTRRLAPLAIHELVELGVEARQHQGHLQLRTKDILPVLDDAWALAAVTMVDLYPDDDWSFVFGFASGRDQVGVFSFARFDPVFHGGTRGPGFEAHMLRRSVKTLSHEIGHMFGISHCTHFHCLMNGHNHEAEGARGPLHLCPVDLRKLHFSHRFDPVARLQRLAEVDRELGLEDEARWLERRLAYVRGE
jgi:archaemetzincin